MRFGVAVGAFALGLSSLNAAEWRVDLVGRALNVETARCSAMPVNIRWPGHQRHLDQTEICSFVRFDWTNETSLIVTPPKDFSKVIVRPASKGAKVSRESDAIRVVLKQPGAYSVEIDGRSSCLFIFADRARRFPVDRAAANVRYFGPGEHDVGLIELKGGQTLYIEEGATVYGRIHACDADGIKIIGKGILDGSRVKEVYRQLDPAKESELRSKGWAVTNANRFDAIRLDFCDDVEIRGITIRDSPLYTIRPVCCDRLRIEGVKIVGNWRYNSDGIDMHNCRDVVIRDCFLRTFDDSICIKGFDYTLPEAEMLHDGVMHDTFENVLVEGCTLWTDWGRSLEIGAETRGRLIRNILFRDCDVICRQDIALDIQNCDQAEVRDVVFENIRVEDDDAIPEPVFSEHAKDFATAARGVVPRLASVTIPYIPEYSRAGAQSRGRVRNVTFRRISVLGPRLPEAMLKGFDADHRVENVVFDEIFFNGCDRTDEFRRGVLANAFVDSGHGALTDEERSSMNVKEGYAFSAGTAGGVKVLFLGNSTALHGPKPEIGWTNNWGMAASAPEKDYVHLITRGIEKHLGVKAEMKVTNVYGFECDYRTWDVAKNLKDEIAFKPDYLFLGFGGNAKDLGNPTNAVAWRSALDRLLSAFVHGDKRPVVIVIGSFWPKAELDASLRELAGKYDVPFVRSDFAGDPGMFAKGLFWHKGVEAHPGDRGMAERARRVLSVLFGDKE